MRFLTRTHRTFRFLKMLPILLAIRYMYFWHSVDCIEYLEVIYYASFIKTNRVFFIFCCYYEYSNLESDKCLLSPNYYFLHTFTNAKARFVSDVILVFIKSKDWYFIRNGQFELHFIFAFGDDGDSMLLIFRNVKNMIIFFVHWVIFFFYFYFSSSRRPIK